MSFNFPNNPTPGQLYTPAGGYQYIYLDGVWRVVESPQTIGTAQTRNRIVNPAMQISQEIAKNTGNTTSGVYLADQWYAAWTVSGTPANIVSDTWLVDDPEVIWTYRLNSSSTPDTSIAAGDYYLLRQNIEGVRIADFRWGTPFAKASVLRFTARSSIAGTFCVTLRNPAGTATFTKDCVIAANTTTKYVIAVPPCTIGTWNTDTSLAIQLSFAVTCGSTYAIGVDGTWTANAALATSAISNWMGAVNQLLGITNVGLYLDPLATGIAPPWQMPDEAEELRACQRYYQITHSRSRWTAAAVNNVDARYYPFAVPMRAAPTVTGTATTTTNCTPTITYLSERSFHHSTTALAAGAVDSVYNPVIASARM